MNEDLDDSPEVINEEPYGKGWIAVLEIENDSELNDLMGKGFGKPQADLLGQYENWAEKAGVLDWEIALPRLLEAWNLQSVEG